MRLQGQVDRLWFLHYPMNRLSAHFIASLLACLFLTQCSTTPRVGGTRAARLKEMGYEAVPLQLVPGDLRYSAEFKVNGKPMRFLIDSGANSTDVDSKLAASVGLRKDKGIKVVSRGALGREISSGRGVGSLQIGSMIAERFPFTIAPSHGRKTSTSSYAGQVGLDALSATGTLIDIPAASMWVPGPNSERGKNPFSGSLGPRQGLGHKILRLGTAGRLPHLVLKGKLDGRLVTWVVDTGAEVSVMAAESFSQFNIPSNETNSRMIDASGDRIALRHARLNNLRFGDVSIAIFDISVAPLGQVQQYFRDANGRPVDGILGMDFLSTGSALLDSGSGILYMGAPRG